MVRMSGSSASPRARVPVRRTSRESLGRVRAEEMKRACEILAVDELIFLGHVDPEGKGYKVFAPEVSAADLAAQLRPHLAGFDLVVSHGSSGEYWHPRIFSSLRRCAWPCREWRARAPPG